MRENCSKLFEKNSQITGKGLYRATLRKASVRL